MVSLQTIVVVVVNVVIGGMLDFGSGANVFSNPVALHGLFELDAQIAGAIRMVLEANEIEISRVEAANSFLRTHDMAARELNALVEEEDDEDEDGDVIYSRLVANLVHVHNLLQRMTVDLPSLDAVPGDLGRQLRMAVETVRNSTGGGGMLALPTEADMEVARLSLARVQFVYRLDPVDLAAGVIGGRRTLARLTAEDCYAVGNERLTKQKWLPIEPSHTSPEYATGIEWLEAALTLSEREDGGAAHCLLTANIARALEDAKSKHDRFFVPATSSGPSVYPNQGFFHAPVLNCSASAGSGSAGRALRREEDSLFRHREGGEADRHGYSRRDFFALCRGERIKLPRRKTSAASTERCSLVTKANPYLRLQPLKREVLYETGGMLVHVFHDVISEKQIKLLKSRAELQLRPATIGNVVSEGGDKSRMSLVRIQSSAWVDEGDEAALKPLSKYLNLVSGLHVAAARASTTYTSWEESEFYQVGAYSPGGLFYAHYDIIGLDTVKGVYVGERTATIMLYLNNLDGGRTVFPGIGVAAKPEKGSVVFWHNKDSAGNKILESKHGGCPVLYGLKWVSNKWIHEASQFNTKPCTLDRYHKPLRKRPKTRE